MATIFREHSDHTSYLQMYELKIKQFKIDCHFGEKQDGVH